MMEFSNKDKETPELTKQDWIDIRRYGRWYTSYEMFFKKKCFGISDLRELLTHKENMSMVAGIIVRYSLDTFLKENEFVVDNVTNLSGDGEYAPSYSTIEYEVGKTKSCLYYGSILFHKDDRKYILELDYGHDTTIFQITAAPNALDCAKILADLLKYAEKHNFFKGKKIDAKCKFISFDKKYTWDDLVLDQDKKDEIRRNLSNVIDYRDVYEKNGLTIKRGLIFYGPPGTGKTLLGKILCNTIDWTFVWVTPKHLQDSRDVSRIVGMCRDLSPSILFLEDIDLFGSDRNNNNNVAVLGELMNQLDGIQENKNVITIATTNNVDVLEKALLKRPGRFDKIIEFKEPAPSNIIEMLKLFSKGINLHEDVNFERMSKSLNSLTGAQLRELVNLAVLYALDAKSFDENKILYVKSDHFDQALPAVRKKDYKSLGFIRNNDDDDDNECPGFETKAPCL